MEARSLPGTQGDFRSLETLRIAGRAQAGRDRSLQRSKLVCLKRSDNSKIPRTRAIGGQSRR